MSTYYRHSEVLSIQLLHNIYTFDLYILQLYISKEKALENFKNNLGEKNSLLNDYNSQNSPIPASIEIKTDSKIELMVQAIQDMPGIAHITTHINTNPYELYLQKLYNLL